MKPWFEMPRVSMPFAFPLAIIGSSTPRAARHLERDVQVEVVLVLELEGHVGRLEEGEVRAVVEPVERVQHAGLAAGFVQRNDFPRLLQLYMGGKLKLDELITRRHSIDEAPQAFADLESRKNARGVIVF